MLLELEAVERWRQHWASLPAPPPTDEQARLLRNTFGTIKPQRERRAA